jgi:hypothetical protein
LLQRSYWLLVSCGAWASDMLGCTRCGRSGGYCLVDPTPMRGNSFGLVSPLSLSLRRFLRSGHLDRLLGATLLRVVNL